jgi:predicted O-methyltransferase YrrM
MILSNNTSLKFWLKIIKRNLIPESLKWRRSNFSSPSPQHVKIKVLKAHSLPNATWIETGTYLGDTTSKLAKIAKKVISIEPQAELSEFASSRLKRKKNVEVINATSESCIATVLEGVSGPTCFWLDGHYSGDVTFQGTDVSPISAELSAITGYLTRNKAVVLIDDFRLFVNSAATGYPSHSTLVAWAVEQNLSWNVEHDIFIAKTLH